MSNSIKRMIAFLLTLVMGLLLIACGSKEVERELISVNVLDVDLDENLARAKQHAGKATHLFGSVKEIQTESFTLNHIFSGRKFSVPMDMASLAELNKGDYIAVYAVIQDIDDVGNVKLKNCKQVEIELMDEYVVNTASTSSSDTLFNSSIVTYAMSRGDTFKMTNDDEIASFMLGKWSWLWNLDATHAEFLEGGECVWGYFDDTYNRWDEAHSSWSVENGILFAFCADDTEVYKITNNVMVTGKRLFVREN